MNEHDGLCGIKVPLINNRDSAMPEAGICTCGYGLQKLKENPGDYSEMYSREMFDKMSKYAGSPSEEIIDRRKGELSKVFGSKDADTRLRDLGFNIGGRPQ